MLFFLKKNFILLLFCFIYIKCIFQDLHILKLPYLSINNNTENTFLRKLSTSNIYGSAFGLNYYYTNLYLGENMEKQTYIIDTGSTITTSPCKFCTKCGNHLNPYFSANNDNLILCNDNKCRLVKSHCGSNNRCSFKTSYSEGSSLEGIFINKLIRFGDDYYLQEGKYAPIGCTTSETHLFLTQKADGIMGLANNEYNFATIMNKVGAINSNIFGLCLAPMGGYFTMGKINTTFHKEKITYINMEKNSLFYNVNMQGIYVSGGKINNFHKSKYSMIIDSGTTISYFPYDIFNSIVDSIKSICNSYEKKDSCGVYKYDRDLGACFLFEDIKKLETALIYYWPNFTFILPNYNYKWTPQQYFFNDTNNKRVRGCMGFNYQSGRFTMGSTWMIGHEIIFDIKNKKIGFVEANCDKNNNKTMTNIGVEVGYNESMINPVNNSYSLYDFFLNDNMLGIYVMITIILFLVIIYLIAVLINFKKRKKNPWRIFGNNKYNNDKIDSFIPIRYDVNDMYNKNNNKEINMVYLKNEKNNNIENSKYKKINE